MARKKSKAPFLHILLSLLFLLLVAGGAIFFAKTYKPPSDAEYLERGEAFLTGLQEELSVEASFQESIYWDWIDENNTLLPLTGKQFLLGTVDTNGIGKYGKVTSDNLEKINKKFFKPIITTSEEYYKTSKFADNEQNQRKTAADPLNETFRGFEKGPIKCLLRLTPQSDPYGYFFCGIVDKEQQKLQKQLTPLFLTKYNPKKPTLFRVDMIEEPFARGNFSESILGYVWIAKKENDIWKIIWKGNEAALCSEMEKLEIPKKIYETCYSE